MKNYSSYKEKINEISVDQYIEELDEIRWFSYFNKKKADEIKSKLRENGLNLWVYEYFSSLFFDAESIEDIGPDSEFSNYYILMEFARISNGKFNPTNIKEIQEYNNSLSLSFDMNGKTYSKEIEFNGWYDDEVTNLVNKSLEDLDVEEKIIKLPETDQMLNFIYMSEKVFNLAVDKKLIPTLKDIS